MKYIIANKENANLFGFDINIHKCDHGSILLNEKEIMSNPRLQGITLREKVKHIGGEIYSYSTIKNILKGGHWNERI